MGAFKIVLATSNKNKTKEIKEFLKGYEIYALDEILTPFEIVEDGDSFKQNALIKARAIYKKLCELNLADEFIALSDDSGISVNALNGAPGIYSARFSDLDKFNNLISKNATDESNRAKLISSLKELNLTSSSAFYTACIALASKYGEFSAHGFMHGVAITNERGKNGFGYDALFIPNGFDKTLGELSDDIKLKISHRSKGLELIRYILTSLNHKFKTYL